VCSLGYAFLGLGFAALLVATLSSARFRFLDNAPLKFLGRYSYGLYVLHGPMAHVAMHALPGSRWGASLTNRYVYLAFMASASAFALGLAVVSWHVLERPFLRMKDRFAAHFHSIDNLTQTTNRAA
jgi:peptidoglycan/LPS O-acetylase OafA/YrhL